MAFSEEIYRPNHTQQSTTCLHFAWRTTSLRVGGRAATPGQRRGGGGRQAGATVLSCLAWRCKLAFRPPSVKKVKVAHTRLQNVGVPELIPVLGSQPAGDVSYKPGGRLPLLSARPVVTPATLKRAATNLLLDEQRHNGCEQFA